ncbi:MAG: polysaccharide lyase family 8 super-sandwich domain-containing protein [Bacteroidales bacterium]
MNYKNILIISKISIYLFILLTLQSCINEPSYDFEEMARRIKTELWSKPAPNTDKLDELVNSQNADGSWADLDYGKLRKRERTSDGHLSRLLKLSIAVTNENCPKYSDKAYLNAISKGLIFWKSSNTVAINWWYNEIFFPQRLGEILILLHDFKQNIGHRDIKIDEAELIKLFKPQAPNGVLSHTSGANAIDIATHYIYRGILTGNGKLIKDTRDTINNTLTDKIGADLIYKDHGPQIQIASYGLVYCSGLIRLAAILADSPAAFDVNSDKFGKVLKFIREVQIASIRGQSWDFSVMGRAVARRGALRAGLPYLKYLADYVDPANAEIYLNALARIKNDKPANSNIREFNKHYWNSDYTQHVRRNYLFTVRNTSTRTVEAEQGNGENTKANYFSYGATFLSVDGTEYMNLMHSWDWNMIPGTTFAYTGTFPRRRNWGFNFGKTAFVGGVSDSTYGAATLDLDKYGVRAKKSWFFFDNEMVCLGTGISDSSGGDLRTTINQAWLQGGIFAKAYKQDKEIELSSKNKEQRIDNQLYIRQGKLAYFFPQSTKISYSSTPAKIQNNNANEVFCLWIDHGTKSANATYSYIVVPNIDNQQKADEYQQNNIEIIINSSEQQAVYHKKLDILETIFHKAGTLKFDDTSIEANHACALMLRNGILTVSDPSQSLTEIEISINSKTQTIKLPPSPEMRGASVSIKL